MYQAEILFTDYFRDITFSAHNAIWSLANFYNFFSRNLLIWKQTKPGQDHLLIRLFPMWKFFSATESSLLSMVQQSRLKETLLPIT